MFFEGLAVGLIVAFVWVAISVGVSLKAAAGTSHDEPRADAPERGWYAPGRRGHYVERRR